MIYSDGLPKLWSFCTKKVFLSRIIQFLRQKNNLFSKTPLFAFKLSFLGYWPFRPDPSYICYSDLKNAEVILCQRLSAYAVNSHELSTASQAP